MGLVARSNAGSYIPAPPGNHLAICVRLIDIGTQVTPFQDEETGQNKEAHQVIITFELCNEMMEDGRPFTINKYYTCSLHEKATLRQHLDSWRGVAFTPQELDGFELRNILGAPCMVNVIHEKKKDGSIRSKISGIGSLPKGMTVPKQVNANVVFDIDKWDDEVFAALGQSLREQILKSNEGLAKFPASKANAATKAGTANGAGHGPVDDSDIPFDPQFSITLM